MRRIVLSVAVLGLGLAGCVSTSLTRREVTNDDVQMVVQWTLPETMPKPTGRFATLKAMVPMSDYLLAEHAMDRVAGKLFVVDGHDAGDRTFNVFLYTDRVEDTMARLMTLEQAGKFPQGMRVAVAQYRDRDHRDWVYRPYYPVGLKSFNLTYAAPVSAAKTLGPPSS